MAVFAKYDIESTLFAAKALIVNNFNAKLAEIAADKALDSSAEVLNPPLELLGGGDAPALAVDVLSQNRKNFIYNPYIWIQLTGEKKLKGVGQHVTEVAVFISITDPHDFTGEVRMMRYMRALDEIFSPSQGVKVGITTLSATEILPYLSRPEYQNATKRRLVWGIGLSLTW